MTRFPVGNSVDARADRRIARLPVSRNRPERLVAVDRLEQLGVVQRCPRGAVRQRRVEDVLRDVVENQARLIVVVGDEEQRRAEPGHVVPGHGSPRTMSRTAW
jgi:hypothetical protein